MHLQLYLIKCVFVEACLYNKTVAFCVWICRAGLWGFRTLVGMTFADDANIFLLPICCLCANQCFLVSWHDVMIWSWPCSIFQNVHLHIIWLGVFASVSPLPHSTLHLDLVHEKQLLRENGCLHLKGIGTNEVMWKTDLAIRKHITSVILVN